MNKQMFWANIDWNFAKKRHFLPTFDEFWDKSLSLSIHPMGESNIFDEIAV